MHKLAQPVKLFYLGPVLPPRAPAGRPLPPVPPDRRRGDRHRLAARRRRGDHAARRPARRAGGARGASCGWAASARWRPARAYLEELKAHLRAHEGELSEDVRERIDTNPLRAFDSDDEGTRAVMASAPTIVERAGGRGRRALRRGAGAARRGRGRLRDRPDPGPRPRLLHAHDLLLRLRRARRPVGDRRRRPLRRPGRAARRPADAGGRLGGGDRADPAGPGRGGRAAGARRLHRRRRRRAAAAGDGAGASSCETPGSRRRSTSPGAARRASTNTPTGSAPAGS